MTTNIEAFERDMNNAHDELQRFTKWKEDMAQAIHASFLAQDFNHYSNTVTPTVDVVCEYIDEAYYEVKSCLLKQKEEAEEEYNRVELQTYGGL
jgi:transcription elongation factor Elf1